VNRSKTPASSDGSPRAKTVVQAALTGSVFIVASLVPAKGSSRQSTWGRLPDSSSGDLLISKCSSDCPALVACNSQRIGHDERNIAVAQ